MKKYTALSILLSSMMCLASTAQAIQPAKTFNLCAGQTTQTLPDSAGVPTDIRMWGFALASEDADPTFATVCPIDAAAYTVPGPQLNVPSDHTILTINVKNRLPEAISIVIPGQNGTTMSPVMFPSGHAYEGRVRSFTHETLTGGTTIGTYTWTGVKAGTFAYHSGTHPAKQVQMGLYGAVVKNFADAPVAGQAKAYDDTATLEDLGKYSYDQDVVLFYSEIDPALHNAVAIDDYGPGLNMTSTIDYQPQYFLVNGQDNLGTTLDVAPTSTTSKVLIRFINMGLKTHVPLINGLYMDLIAENGHAYPYARQQYTAYLAAGKTMDAFITVAAGNQYAIFDRMLYLTNRQDAAPGITPLAQNSGGLISILEVAAAIVDTDGDGVADDADNCTLVANADQRDSNNDNFGNICDPDLNNDGVVSFGDYGILRGAFSSTNNPDADLNGDGVVSFGDYGILRSYFGKAPGPSGTAPAP